MSTSLVAAARRPVVLHLSKDLVRSIKRGHPWIFSEALRERPPAPAGSVAVLLDRRGEEIAHGFYDARSQLAFRACTLRRGEKPDDAWAQERLRRARSLRRALFGSETTGFRLLNGEGDGTPGLVCDVYGDTAVVRLDGDGPSGFWNAQGIAAWLVDELGIRRVFEKPRERGARGRMILGDASSTSHADDRDAASPAEESEGGDPSELAGFLENGARYTADVVRGQKTGFFLDQRENRALVRRLAAGRSVLNTFAYTGGFSISAGLGGASRVTTVDLAKPAVEAARRHWELNGLPSDRHETVAADVFDFFEGARRQGRKWDFVILDPPSFAPSRAAVPAAQSAYQKLITAGAQATAGEGLLAAASCSSHIAMDDFLAICEEGVSKASRRATLLGVHGQPADHPVPLPSPEFRYLKFVLMRLD